MALQQGTRLGAYEIMSPLGTGGMGEVYRARDTKLQRDVALKILPETMARDAQRMARFEREAQVLASLNHPNIAAIYGLEDSKDVRALVMELVEGQTLGERISVAAVSRPPGGFPERKAAGEDTGTATGERRSLMATDEALPIAKQIAEALEYAHERGVIHRDLKPANVNITPEGTVKVLDFGLAKVLDPHDSTATMDMANSPTLSAMATQAGVILGTAAYMSPEQAKGQRVDRRTDIWAFGCVLYEMLSGRKPFEGQTISEVLASVIKTEPDWSAIPDTTPPSIQRLVRRCLIKDPKQRLQAIGEARITIEETLSGSTILPSPLPPGEGGPEERDRVRVSPLRRALPWIIAGILICVAALSGWWLGTRSVASPSAWSGELLPGPAIAFWPRVSPDGHLIAFEAMVDNQTQVAVMDPRSGNWTVLTQDRTHGPVASLCWSQDGSTIYFDRVNPQPVGIYSVSSLGGEQRLVLSNAASPELLPDGSMLVVRVDPNRNYEIFHYWPGTGSLQPMEAWVNLNPSAAIRVLPDGKGAVFFGTAKGKPQNSPHLYLLDIATGKTRRLAPDLPITQSAQLFPLAVAPGGRSVLIDLPSGNLHRIVEIPISGQNSFRTLLTLTSAPWALDVAPDGNLYVDQVSRPLEVLRFPASGGTPVVLANVESYLLANGPVAPVEFSDGKFLLPTFLSGRPRLLLGKPGGNFVSLLQTAEESAPPIARVGNDEVALMAGSGPAQALAVASVRNGDILHRFKATEGMQIAAVAASPDGQEIYYVAAGNVWVVPSQGGTPRQICAGDGVAVAPDGRSLVVNLNEEEHVRLERVLLPDGILQPIHVKSDFAVSPVPLGPNAINKEGKLLVNIAPSDSWFWGLGVLYLATGKLTRLPLNYSGDIFCAAWASDGSILATADPLGAHIWRFRPEH